MQTQMTASPGTSTIEQTLWRIDPDRSSVGFHAKNLWGLATVRGRFSRYQGTLDLFGEPAIELTVEADSLDTRNRRRDKHLRSPDFFDAARHPYVRFVAQDAELEGTRLRARGHLHARGVSIPLDIDATLSPAGDELEIEAVVLADHRQLGMTWSPVGMVRAPSKLIVNGRLCREG